MRHLAQARNPYSRWWLWIPGSRKSAPRNDDREATRKLKMQLGMIGLGRMGGNIVRRLMKHGHTTVVYDRDPKAVAALAADGSVGAEALEEFVAKLERPRTIRVRRPPAPTPKPTTIT